MKKSFLFVLLICILSSGCGIARYRLEVDTSPKTKGVKIYANDKYVGKTNDEGEFSLKTIRSNHPIDYITIKAKDGDFLGQATFQYEELENWGKHKSKNLLERRSKELFEGFTEYHRHYVLFGPIPQNPGILKITSNVFDVKIYLDGKYLGKIDYSKKLTKKLDPGRYSIKAMKDNYNTVEKPFNITKSETKYLNLNLKEKPSAKKPRKPRAYGYLRLTSNEKYVDVYIDGKLKGQIPGGEVPFNKKISAGEHTIMVKKQFFSPNSIRVDVNENEIIPYHFELIKAAEGSELKATTSNIYQTKGNLTILTERNDFVVYIDDTRRIPPIQLTDIPAGFYNIKVKAPGINESFRITVEDKKTTLIDLDDKFPRK